MRKNISPIKWLAYSLGIGLLVFYMQSCGKLPSGSSKGSLPKAFNDNVPLTMKKWYDEDTTNGEIELNVRQSHSNWDDFTPKVAPKGAPNILFILYDDTGLGAWSPYGGSIEMPTMDSIAAAGLIYTQWHTTSLCSPTRSTILTGRNHHLNGMASITETADGFPGGNGRLPKNCVTFPTILQESGYSTFWIGKNHNVPETDVAPGGYRGSWPCQMGFDRFYGFLGGETNNWYPDLVEDNHFIEAPSRPKDGYHLSKDLTNQAIKMLRNQNASNPSKPWYMWFCPGANHAPHHAPDSVIQKYRNQKTFQAGYEVYRDTILQRMIDKGILPNTTTVTALNFLPNDVVNPMDTITPWDSLDDETQNLFISMAEAYAGFSTYTDYQVGRIIDYLKESGQYENTIIIYAADNGASGEGTPAGSVNENKFFNGYPDDMDENMLYDDKIGSPQTYNHFPTGWAAAFSTPFKMFKRYSEFAGGTNDPLVISWPRYMKKQNVGGEIRHQYHHSVDIVPTLIEAINKGVKMIRPNADTFIKMPETYNGIVQKDLSGVSMLYTFDGACEDTSATNKKVQYYCMLGTRGIWENGWKAVALHSPTSGKSDFKNDVWELYHVEKDRSESINLVADTNCINGDCNEYEANLVKYQAKLDSLKDRWFEQAAINNVLPLDDRAAEEMFLVERPSPERPRKVYRYYPKTTAVPEGVAVNVRGRSYTIRATVEGVTNATKGVLFAHGSRFGGHTMYIKRDSLIYLYNFLGISAQQYRIAVPIEGLGSIGKTYVFEAKFKRDTSYHINTDPEAEPSSSDSQYGESKGTLTLSVANGKKIFTPAYGLIYTQPAKFTLSGDGLCVGYDSADPITTDYPNFIEKGKFEGGRIRYVEVIVPGNPIINRKAEARRALMRE